MGLTHAILTLVNAVDSGNAKRHKIGQEEVRQMPVRFLVDTGAAMLIINEEIRDILGLDAIEGKRVSRLADGSRVELNVVGPVEVHFEGRLAMCNALVLPGDEEPLLGAIPMEELDVVVHPLRQTLEGRAWEWQGNGVVGGELKKLFSAFSNQKNARSTSLNGRKFYRTRMAITAPLSKNNVSGAGKFGFEITWFLIKRSLNLAFNSPFIWS